MPLRRAADEIAIWITEKGTVRVKEKPWFLKRKACGVSAKICALPDHANPLFATSERLDTSKETRDQLC